MHCGHQPVANIPFLPRDATQTAVRPMRLHVVCLSVRLSVRNDQVPWSHRLEFFENNFTSNSGLCARWLQHRRSGATGTPQN